MPNANHTSQDALRDVGESRLEALKKSGEMDKILENSGISPENLKIANAVLDLKKDVLSATGYEVGGAEKSYVTDKRDARREAGAGENTVEAYAGKIKELLDQWTDDLTIVSETTKNDKRLYNLEDASLKTKLEILQPDILSRALDSGNLHGEIETTLFAEAKKMQAERDENIDFVLETEEVAKADKISTDTLKEEAVEIAEPVIDAPKEETPTKPLEVSDQDYEDAFKVDADTTDKEGLDKAKEYKGLSLAARMRSLFKRKK